MHSTEWRKLSLFLKDFIAANYNSDRPLLLALSGGPDSIVLFHLLLEGNLPFHVAHVNHGWRRESSEEAELLASMCQRLAVPFHLKVLQDGEGKTEDSARKERYQFFLQLKEELEAEAVILGHHADDLAETVLKRVLEGASLVHLSPMQSTSQMNELTLWRPLLGFKKKAILEALKEKQIDYFIDETNENPQYLRARLRKDILPLLNEKFGKEVTAPLCTIADEAEELHHYMERINFPIEEGPLGWKLDTAKFHPYEVRYFLKKKLNEQGIVPSAEQLRTAVQLLPQANKQMEFRSHGTLYIDRDVLFFMKQLPEFEEKEISIDEGSYAWCGWQVSVDQCDEIEINPILGWQNLWNGHLNLYLPKKSFVLKRPAAKDKFKNGQPLDKLWGDSKVPAFLRYSVPAIYSAQDGHVCAELLSGRHYLNEESPYYKVALTR